ncbi:hypothetical protein ES708_09088 [subsurface metagenome]
MERLVKDVNNLCNIFFREEAGNRLSQFGFGAFKEILLKMIKDYKITEKNKEIKK